MSTPKFIKMMCLTILFVMTLLSVIITWVALKFLPFIDFGVLQLWFLTTVFTIWIGFGPTFIIFGAAPRSGMDPAGEQAYHQRLVKLTTTLKPEKIFTFYRRYSGFYMFLSGFFLFVSLLAVYDEGRMSVQVLLAAPFILLIEPLIIIIMTVLLAKSIDFKFRNDINLVQPLVDRIRNGEVKDLTYFGELENLARNGFTIPLLECGISEVLKEGAKGVDFQKRFGSLYVAKAIIECGGRDRMLEDDWISLMMMALQDEEGDVKTGAEELFYSMVDGNIEMDVSIIEEAIPHLMADLERESNFVETPLISICLLGYTDRVIPHLIETIETRTGNARKYALMVLGNIGCFVGLENRDIKERMERKIQQDCGNQRKPGGSGLRIPFDDLFPSANNDMMEGVEDVEKEIPLDIDRILKVITGFVGHEDDDLREIAFEDLRLMAWPLPNQIIREYRLLEHFLKGIGDPCVAVRCNACDGIKMCGEEGMREDIISWDMEQAKNIDPEETESGKERVEGGLEAIIKLLDDDEPKVRYSASEALGVIGDTRAIPKLERLIDDSAEAYRFTEKGKEKIRLVSDAAQNALKQFRKR